MEASKRFADPDLPIRLPTSTIPLFQTENGVCVCVCLFLVFFKLFFTLLISILFQIIIPFHKAMMNPTSTHTNRQAYD